MNPLSKYEEVQKSGCSPLVKWVLNKVPQWVKTNWNKQYMRNKSITLHKTNKCITNNRFRNWILVKQRKKNVFIKKSLGKWDRQWHWKRLSTFPKSFFYFQLHRICGNNSSFGLDFPLIDFKLETKIELNKKFLWNTFLDFTWLVIWRPSQVKNDLNFAISAKFNSKMIGSRCLQQSEGVTETLTDPCKPL
jgi:hypothetical protein